MRREVTILCCAYLVGGCSAATVRPVDLAPIVAEHCKPERINPPEFRNLRANQAVRRDSYLDVRDANLNCANRLLETAEQNRRAAEANKLAAKQSWWDGIQWGAIGVLLVEVLIYVL